MTRTDDGQRLERLLAVRREEEERARLREAAASRRVKEIRRRLRKTRSQLRTCRACCALGSEDAGQLLDAHHCAARLHERLQTMQEALECAETELATARQGLAEAGRRRLAVERLAGDRALRARQRREAAQQAQLDESGRLRSLLEGNGQC